MEAVIYGLIAGACFIVCCVLIAKDEIEQQRKLTEEELRDRHRAADATRNHR